VRTSAGSPFPASSATLLIGTIIEGASRATSPTGAVCGRDHRHRIPGAIRPGTADQRRAPRGLTPASPTPHHDCPRRAHRDSALSPPSPPPGRSRRGHATDSGTTGSACAPMHPQRAARQRAAVASLTPESADTGNGPTADRRVAPRARGTPPLTSIPIDAHAPRGAIARLRRCSRQKLGALASSPFNARAVPEGARVSTAVAGA
jgi:hypothetical protein